MTGTDIKVVDSVTGLQRIYRYYHLTYQSYDADFYAHYLAREPIESGKPINRVGPWSCNYNHLHYDMYDLDTQGAPLEYVNPLKEIRAAVRPDTVAPDIFGDIGLVPHGTRWGNFTTAGGWCTVVKGSVDIVAHLRDRDEAGSPLPGATNVGVFNLRWRACSSADPNCPWKPTYVFERMPVRWGDDRPSAQAEQQFSTTPPFKSDFNVCPAPDSSGNIPVNQTYMVATSTPSSSWNTADASVPNGLYAVSVEASDVTGNATTSSINACVQNPACKDLSIRDAEDDVGTIPYAGVPFHLSPDITLNPGTPDENQNVRLGVSNTIEVQVWNRGACNLPANTTYEVCLAWNPPSPTIPFPLPANQLVSCKSETVPATGWAPGTSRKTTLNWVPVGTDVPSGHACLVAWSNMSGDSTQMTSSVVLDNNRAQRNVMFVPLPQPGTMSTAAFWEYPLGDVPERNIDISFHPTGSGALPDMYLVLPPTVRVRELANARVISSFRGPIESCVTGDYERCIQLCPGPGQACMQLIGGFDPSDVIHLKGVRVAEPTKLLFMVTVPRTTQAVSTFEAVVVEGAAPAGRPPYPIGGLTLRFGGVKTQADR
jgi:hypothetical protein